MREAYSFGTIDGFGIKIGEVGWINVAAMLVGKMGYVRIWHVTRLYYLA